MSYRTVAHHALTFYYDGNAELARKVLDGLTADALSTVADVIGERASAHSEHAQEVLSGVEYDESEELVRSMADDLYAKAKP